MKKYIKMTILACIMIMLANVSNAQSIAFNIETYRGYFFQNSSGDDIQGFSFRPVYRQSHRLGFQYQYKRLGVNASVMVPGTGSSYIVNTDDSFYFSHKDGQYNI